MRVGVGGWAGGKRKIQERVMFEMKKRGWSQSPGIQTSL